MCKKLSNIILFFILTNVSFAQEVYQLNTAFPVHALDDYLQVIEDKDQALTVEQIIQDTHLIYAPLDSFPRLLDVGPTYWAKFQVRSTDSLQGWTLELEDKWFQNVAWLCSNGKVDVYAFANGKQLFRKKTGVDYAKSEREIKDKWILNRVYFDVPKDELVTVVIKVEGNSFGMPPYFNVSVRQPGFQSYYTIFRFWPSFAIFIFGVTFIIFLYHFLQYLYLKQKVFLWFSVWTFLSMVTQFMTTGLDTEFFLGNVPKLRFSIFLLIPGFMLSTFWFFGRSFVNSKEKFPKLDKLMIALPILMIIEPFIHVGMVTFGDPYIYMTNVGARYKFIAFFSALGLILAIILAFKKDPFARYFGIGAIIATSSTLLGGLWSDRLIRLSFDPYTWGILLQVIAYSFGIAYRQQRLTQRAEAEKLEAERNRAEVQRIRDYDDIKTRFFTNLSHEFRTPLSLILGPLQQARKNTNVNPHHPDQPIRLSAKSFSIIERNTLRLQNLVDQLLDLSKLESGKVHFNLTRGPLITFIRSLVFSFESMAERRNISLNTNFPVELNTAYFDKDKLEKILTNLLSNAFKYTPEGGAVTVAAQHDKQYYTLEISDTGKGMDKEEVKRIFERFYRVEGTEEKGSGIGLALTKELVDVMNGQIQVNSTKGQGTTFKVRLPYTLKGLPGTFQLVDETTKPSNDQTDEALITDIGQQIPAVKTLSKDLPIALVVEDNEDLRSYISSVIGGHYNVLTSKDGLQGERMAFEHIPDIVISDVMMPKKDGFELCHSLKSNVKTSHIPIIMLTAKAGQDNKMEGLTQGADAYLTKPFDDDELLLRMRNLINARQKIWDHLKSNDLLVINDLPLGSVDDEFLQKVIATIKTNLDNEHFSVEDIARKVGFSRSQLHRKLKALTNQSAIQLIVEMRLNEAKRMLKDKSGTVSEIAYSVGYSNMSYFTKSFKEKFGILPSKV